MIEFNDANFDADVMQSDVPVLVEFGATWCGPCQQQLPILEEISKEWEGKLKVGKVDVDTSSATAQKFRVMSVPQLFVFQGGEQKLRLTGFTPRADLENQLKELEGLG